MSPIPADVQAALDAISDTVTANRQLATNAIQADRVRLDSLDTRLDAGADRLNDLEEAARRLRRAFRDGRLDGEGTFVDALAAALDLSVSDLRAALAWVTQERRKARR